MTIPGLRCSPVLALLLVAPLVAWAAGRATPEEAQAMVADVIAHYDAEGAEATFAAVNAADPAFSHGDLYVFVLSVDDGSVVAHGANAALVGRQASSFEDVDGKAFAVEQLEVATPDGVWVDYKWTDPLTGEVAPKSGWVVLHDGYVFGAGVYQP